MTEIFNAAESQALDHDATEAILGGLGAFLFTPTAELVAVKKLDKGQERVKEAEESAASLDEKQKKRVIDLQLNLESGLPKIGIRVEDVDSLVKRIEDERKGIVRNDAGEIIKELGKPYFGKASQEGFRALLGYLEEERVPGLYQQVAESKGELSVDGPLKLEIYDEGILKGKVVGPDIFIADAVTGKLRCDLKIAPEKVPTAETMDKLEEVGAWSDRTLALLENPKLIRMQEIARRALRRNGFPSEWKIDSAAECAAAMFVVRTTKETTRLVEAIDFAREKIEGDDAKRKWADMLKPENLPAGVTVQRENNDANGRVTKVVIDFPKNLEPSSPEFRKMLRDLHKWCDEVSPQVEQMLDELNKGAKKPENVYAWMDLEYPFGQVYMGPDNDKNKQGDFKPSTGNPESADWKRFNLIEIRCQAEEKRNPATNDLEKVKLTGTLRYCDVPLWSYLNLYKPQAAGTNVLKPEDKWRDPKDWVCVKTGPDTVKVMQAKDVQDFADMQAFWHYTDKAVTIAMDASMLLGVGELAQAVRIGRALRTAEGTLKAIESAAKVEKAVKAVELLEKVKSSTAMLKVAQREMQAVNAAAKFHASKQIILGLSAPLNNAAVKETPILKEAALARSMVFMFDITKGTVYDPAKWVACRAMFGRRVPTMGEQLFQAVKLTQPQFLRGVEKSGRYGFLSTQAPFVVSMINHINGQVKDLSNDEVDEKTKAVVDRVKSADAARDRRELEEKKFGVDAKLTAKTLADNLEQFAVGLGNDQDPQVQEMLKELRPLLEAPSLADGKIDVSALSDWRAKRQKFVEDKLVPILLASGQQIADAEKARAEALPYGKEFRDNKTFSDAQVHLRENKNLLNPRPKALKDFAAAALVCVSRDAWGNLDSFGPPPVAAALEAAEKDARQPTGKITATGDNNKMNFQFTLESAPSFQTVTSGKLQIASLQIKRDGAELKVVGASGTNKEPFKAEQLSALQDVLKPLLAELEKNPAMTPEKAAKALHAFAELSGNVLFARDTVVPAWTVTKNVSATSEPEMVVFAVPQPPNKRSPLRQELLASEMMTLLEKNLLSGNSASSRMCAGELLCRAGMPAEVYASTLKSVITASDTKPEEKTEAILRLAGVASAIQQNEVSRQTLQRDDQFILNGLATGNSSRALRDFLHKLSCDPAQSLDDRALARFMVIKLDRVEMSKEDAIEMEKVISDGKLSYPDFVKQMTAASNAKASSSVEIERKMNAILALMEFCDADGNLITTPAMKGQQETMSSLTVKLAGIPGEARELSAVAIKARQTVRDTASKLNAPGLSEDARKTLETELEKNKSELKKVERNRVRADELAIRCAEELLKPVNRNGLSRQRIVHMDQTGLPEEKAAAQKARQNCIELLKGFSSRLEDVSNKRRLIELLPALLQDHESHLPGKEPEKSSPLALMRSEFALGLKAVLFPKSCSKADYEALWATAQEFPELRSAAIKSLELLGDTTAAWLIKIHVMPETEPDAGVRLEAARSLPRVAPGGVEEVRVLFQELLNRASGNAKTPQERDPAVALALQTKYDPVGLGESPDEALYKKSVEEAKALIKEGEKSTIDLRKLLQTEEYKWITGAALREEIRSAKDNTYSNVFSFSWDKAATVFGFVKDDTVEIEMVKSQNKAVEEFRRKFHKLLTTAFEDEGPSGQQAREVLFALLTDNGQEWEISDKQLSDQKTAGRFSFSQSGSVDIWAGRQTFEGMRLVVAKQFSLFCRGLNDGKPLPDPQLRKLEKMLYSGLCDPNTPAAAKLYLMDGIFAIAEKQSTGRPDKAQALPSYGIAAVIEALNKTLRLDPPVYMSADESLKEMEARKELALKMIDYIGKYNTTRSKLQHLDAIALSQPLQKGEKDNDKTPPAVKQRALEMIGNSRDRIWPLWTRTKEDQSGSMTAERRAYLLAIAQQSAQFYLKNGERTDNAGKVEMDALLGMQARKDECAINDMFAAVKGYRIEKESDPVGASLTELLQKSYSDRVRLGAAVALLLQSQVRSQRDEAIAVLADLSVSGRAPGHRKDAYDALQTLKIPDTENDKRTDSKEDIQPAITSLETRRNDILNQMKTELLASTKLSPECSTNELMDAYVKDGKDRDLRMRLAVTLSNLGMLQTKQGFCMEAQENTLAAINLFRNQPVETPLGSEDALDHMALEKEFKDLLGGSEFMVAAINSLSHYGVAQSHGLLPDWRRARAALEMGQSLRRDLLGEKHPATLDGALQISQVTDRELEKAEADLNDLGLKVIGLKKELAALGTADAARDTEEVKQSRKSLEADVKTATERYLDAQNKIRAEYENHARYLTCVFRLTRAIHGNTDSLADVQFKRAVCLDKAAKSARLCLALSTTDEERKFYQAKRDENEKSAEEFYTQVIKHRTASTTASADKVADSRLHLADLYWRQDRFVECREQLEQSSRLYPGTANVDASSNILNWLARVNLKLDDEKQAAQAFAKKANLYATAFGAKSMQALDAMAFEAVIRSEFKQYDRAVEILKMSIAQLGDQQPAYRAALQQNLYVAYFHLGKRPEMIDALTKSVELYQDTALQEDQTARMTAILARWQAVSGEGEQAAKTMQTFKSKLATKGADPNGYQYQHAIAVLTELSVQHKSNELAALKKLIEESR